MKLHKDGTVEGTPQEIAEYRVAMYPIKTLPPSDIRELTSEHDVAPATKWLSEELEKRTGVEVHKIAPHAEYSLIIGHVRHDRTGPATILINID